MGKVKVTLVKGQSGHTERQRKSLRALGLNKISSSAEHTLTPQVKGIINKVQHMVSVENI